jgi:quercetin dioxygenase-like cupin family protein
MMEKTYAFARTDDKAVERVVERENVVIAHVVLPGGEMLPAHDAQTDVFMVIIRGRLTLGLDGQPGRGHAAGSIVEIPAGARMAVHNRDGDTLEFFVVRAVPGSER